MKIEPIMNILNSCVIFLILSYVGFVERRMRGIGFECFIIELLKVQLIKKKKIRTNAMMVI